ncbi:BlpC ABC transporter [Streptococcus pyogenes]|nr:putative bacteriocin secretion accessory protein [Streptococcus pyogenes]VGQ71703.1 putative bacteriocin secretion accessory protein [Streptococcus pyogenes]VGU92358.1 BlpC ABC transporter [Streptococcus pyogenes]
MEASQKTALETQRNTYQRQKAGLETLINSLKEETNLFTSQDDEFGYINTFNSFITQSQDIELGISKANTEVNNQAVIAGNTAAAIDSQIATLTTQLTQYQELYTAISTNQSNLPTGNPHQATLDSYHSQYNLTPDSSITSQYLSQINSSITSLESSIGSLNIQKASSVSAATYDSSTSTKIEVLKMQFIQTASQQLTTISTQLTDTENQLVQADTLLENTQILAPANSVIHLNSEFEGETFFPKGSEIAQIFPDIAETKEVLITFYVSSSEVTQLNKNQTARLSLEKIGNEAITITGKIQSIDTSATKTEQGNLFKVTALAQVSINDSKFLKYGTQGRVTCIIATKTFFDYYKDKLLHQLD